MLLTVGLDRIKIRTIEQAGWTFGDISSRSAEMDPSRVASPTCPVSRTMGTIISKPLIHVTRRRHGSRLRQGPRRWHIHTTGPVSGISSPSNQRSWRSGTSHRGNSLAREWNHLDSTFVIIPPWHPVNAAGSQARGGRVTGIERRREPVSHWKVSSGASLVRIMIDG